MASSPDDVRRALEQLSDIHVQVARASIYRGYRAVPVAAMGVFALLAAAAEAFWPSPLSAGDHANWWLIVAALCGSLGAIDLWRRRHVVSGRDTWIAVGQLVPSLLVGLALGWLLSDRPAVLPGVWTMVFGLGVLASRPFLPAGILGVALFYVTAGFAMAAAAHAGTPPSPWTMGITFFAGQLTSAAILRRSAAEEDRT